MLACAGPQHLHLLWVAIEQLDQPDGGLTGRRRSPYLESTAAPTDDAASFFLGELQLLAHRLDPRGIGGTKFTVGLIKAFRSAPE
jgi:hypothetical protein